MHCAQSLLSDELAHPIDPEPRDEDDEDDDMDTGDGGGRVFGDWEVTDFEPPALGARRVIRVAMRKKGLGMMVHWWHGRVRSISVRVLYSHHHVYYAPP